jgi:anti-sigma regulatory factor (Ser/Thr protein kinase)
MKQTLLDAWLPDADALLMRDDASVSLAREAVRELGAKLGASVEAIEKMAIVASELGHNQLRHGAAGRMLVREVRRGEALGLEVVAADRGKGIADPTRALRGEVAQPRGRGARLSAGRRHAQEVDVDVRRHEGTYVAARLFLGPVPFRSEVGVFARPLSGEPLCGDDAAFSRSFSGLTFAVADGLGHGPEARAASSNIVSSSRHGMTLLAEQVRAAHVDAAGTRGATAVVGRIDGVRGELELVGVGDVSVAVVRARDTTRFRGRAGVVGGRSQLARSLPSEVAPLLGGDVVLAYSDGIRLGVDFSALLPLRFEHPIVLAQALLERFARDDDDALVFAAR